MLSGRDVNEIPVNGWSQQVEPGQEPYKNPKQRASPWALIIVTSSSNCISFLILPFCYSLALTYNFIRKLWLHISCASGILVACLSYIDGDAKGRTIPSSLNPERKLQWGGDHNWEELCRWSGSFMW